MPSFYENPENLVEVLKHYYAIFSEGHEPIVPLIRNSDGQVDVVKTLAIALDFPASERAIWMEHWRIRTGRIRTAFSDSNSGY